jgi:two-component system chemotaxis sensor kinase CheA
MDDLLRDFLTESNENLARLDREIVALERTPDDRELLASIFRTIHTIKGTCGFLNLTRLEGVAHAAESVLGLLRDGTLTVRPDTISDVLAAVDTIKTILEGLERTSEEPAGDDSAVVARLERWLAGAPAEDATAPAHAVAAPEPTRGTAARDVEVAPAGGGEEAPDGGERPDSKPSIADSSLRVNVTILDRLMNMVGELVLTRNQLIQLSLAEEDSVYLAPVQHLNRVTTDLQEAVMKTRMQAVGGAWGKLPRLVRDLCQANGKRIELEMRGAETELDRQILQAIQDPLTHMIRNSADHGIESPEERRRAGKPERGTITLNAYHEGGHVILEVGDDGAGIDPAKIRQKAVERGLVKAEAAAVMPDAQVLRFIFEPGFSTAARITNVSGRGVGMDVVRSNIERIGGTVDVTSRVGTGSTVRIKIPLTLAIISALVVGTGGESFAIPQIGVVELVRVTEEARQHIESVHGSQFYRLRDTLLPLVQLDRMLELEEAPHSTDYSIVVCQVGEVRFGLVVSEVFDTQEIVVKPIGRLVKHLSVYAGCTILGDGRVIMILDAAGIAACAKVGAADEGRAGQAGDSVAGHEGEGERLSLLLFDTGQPALQAVPLSLVSRLEEFPAAKIEFADGRSLVQYRGALLPLVPADHGITIAQRDPQPVIVFSDGRHSMGLVVNEIRDIVEDRIRIETSAGRPGILGAAVINGRATEVVDIHHFLKLALNEWFEAAPGADARRGKRVLVVDDSPFFLNLLTPILRASGYEIATSDNGRSALERLERGEEFDIVLSDIDMPQVDGLELARRIRQNPAWERVKLIALTGRSSPSERQRGLAAGYSRYLVKLDRDAVLAALAEVTMGEEVAA